MSDSKKTPSASQADKKLEKSMKALSGKQRQKEAAERKEARKWRTYGIMTGVVVVLIAALLFWDSGFIQRRAAAVKVGNESYSAAEVDYYYYTLYSNMYSYASYYGLDTSKSLKEQTTSDGQTWHEYFCDSAKTSLTNVSTLAQEAKAAGFELNDDTKEKIQKDIDDTKQAAKDNNVSYKYYLRRVFGRLMTPSVYAKVVEEYEYAAAYEDFKTESFDVSDDEVQAYYKENKDTIDSYDYVAYRVDASPDTKDEDGNTKELTAEDYAAADKAAKKTADAIVNALKSGDTAAAAELAESDKVSDYSDISSASLSNYPFGEWLVDAKRVSGDTKVVKDTTTATIGDEEQTVTKYYYAVLFNDRTLDEYYAGTVHTILVAATASDDSTDYGSALAKAEELKQQFEAGEKTEEAFQTLSEEAIAAHEEEEEVEEDTADASASAEAEAEPHVHLTAYTYESVKKASLSEDMKNWLYGTEHKSGDVDIVQDTSSSGYRLVYFVGYDDSYTWYKDAVSALQGTAYSEWLESISENYELTETSFFQYVG